MLKLVTHTIYEGGELPPFLSNVFYEYWLAGNGLYLRAKRSGLEILMPLAPAEVRGLPALRPYFKLDYPLIPGNIFLQILELARQARGRSGESLETLFHLRFCGTAGEWELEVPEQEQTRTGVRPLDGGTGTSYEHAFLELHSHHGMPAFFSEVDDRDEARSFRLFAVIGNIFGKVEIWVRLGVFGYFWRLDPGVIFDLPEEIRKWTSFRPVTPPGHFAYQRHFNEAKLNNCQGEKPC